MTIYRQIIAGCALFSILSTCAASAFAETIPDRLVLHYDLFRDGTPVAEVQRTIQREGSYYRATSIAEPTGVARLLVSDLLHEESLFAVEGHNVRPLQYFESRDTDSANQTNIRFDWQQRKIQFSDGRSLDIPEHEVQDISSFQVALMVRPIKELAGQRINVVNIKGIREYRYETPVEEVIETALGKLRTWRIEQRRLNRPERSVTVWLAIDLGHAPVKVVSSKNDKTTTLAITTIEGIESTELPLIP
jgi:hypothetical protein